ncbi:MAG: ABC transporter permease [archaeon]|nr:ABC transporter permease [archaeon]
MRQILDVVQFEIRKSLKKFLILLGVEVFFLVISIILPIFLSREPLPDEISSYLSGIIGNITLLVTIMSCSYGGSIIANEFDKKTGYMLFPKVSRSKLFIGKWISQYLLLFLNVVIYYLFALIAAIINYSEVIPIEFYQSFFFAALYGAMLFSFVMMFSSFMKSSSLTITISFLLLFMGFSLISSIITLVSIEIEPLYDLSYYGNVVTLIFNFPEERFLDIVLQLTEEDTFTMRAWLTPALNTFIFFNVIYIALFNIIGYFAFRRREL